MLWRPPLSIQPGSTEFTDSTTRETFETTQGKEALKCQEFLKGMLECNAVDSGASQVPFLG